MNTETAHTLVPSTNRGGSALDDPEQSHDLTSGEQAASCWVGSGPLATLSTPASSMPSRGLSLLTTSHQATPSSPVTAGNVCGLCTGMQVRVR